MFKMHNCTIPLAAASAMVLSGCSNDMGPMQADSDQVTASGGSPAPEVAGRGPEDPILGTGSADGLCDESVVKIDRGRPTADITYVGQPGDRVEITLKRTAESEPPVVQSFEMSRMQTEMQLPTGVPNETISELPSRLMVESVNQESAESTLVRDRMDRR